MRRREMMTGWFARPARRSAVTAGVALLAGAGLTSAQSLSPLLPPIDEQPLEQIPVLVHVDSGMLSPGLRPMRPHVAPVLMYQTEIAVPGAPWIRLQFDKALLSGDELTGDNAFIWLTSVADGAVQVMTRRDLDHWGNTSAYFNGDRVRVELYAYPGAGDVQLQISTVLIGPGGDRTSTSLCGADNRVASTDPRSARVLPIQCTVFLIDDQTHNFLTAGHCAGGLSVVQFNVPPSTSSGVIVNPPPEDQYPVDPASIQSQFFGVGQDWSYFGCFANSNTGLTPFQAQGSFYFTANAAPPVINQTIRITGYGTDTTPATSNQTLQTATGPYVERTGTIIRYAVDTTGGNSGSAVIDLTTGQCIGIHTNAGCSSTGTGSNSGTAIQHTALQAALANPAGVTAAPDCDNNGVPDSVDIQQGAPDCNNNGVLDSCEFIIVPGDLTGDNIVDGADLAVVLAAFGSAEGGAADLNGDGVVDGADISFLLNNWGTPCG